MPKLKQKEKPFAKLARLIRSYLDIQQLGSALRKSDQTARIRMKSPWKFTLEELWMISTEKGIPWDEIIEAIR